MPFLPDLVRRIASPFLLAHGRKRWLLAFAAGAVSVLSLPPFSFLPVLFVTLPALVWLIDGAAGVRASVPAGRRLRAGLAIGWWFGFGYFLAGLWWIGSAFLVEADQYAWMLPFAIAGLPAGLALFHAVAVAIATRFWPEHSGRLLLLAGLLAMSDWLRGHILTGFPWNSFGYSVSGSLPLSQTASLVGIYGLSAIVTACAASPAALAGMSRRNWLPLACSLILLAGLWGWGTARLGVPVTLVQPELNIRVIQPNIAQKEKWLPENKVSIFRSYLGLSKSARKDDASSNGNTVFIWPESAFPFLLTSSPEALDEIDSLLEPHQTLVAGAIRAEKGPDSTKYYNSIYVISDGGTIREAYDKVRLVPFGEYLPLGGLLEDLGISRLVNSPGAFTPGYEPRVLETSGLPPFLPLICYEAIFPQMVQDAGKRPSWLLNVTNDAWFGDTAGPYQHLAQARFRAIEQGLPLVRSANTGISAIIDPYGRIAGALALDVSGVIDAQLAAPLPPTLYSLYGDVALAGILIVFTAFFTLTGLNLPSRHN
jgi:apolipoprotein N-acyltransferase